MDKSGAKVKSKQSSVLTGLQQTHALGCETKARSSLVDYEVTTDIAVVLSKS